MFPVDISSQLNMLIIDPEKILINVQLFASANKKELCVGCQNFYLRLLFTSHLLTTVWKRNRIMLIFSALFCLWLLFFLLITRTSLPNWPSLRQLITRSRPQQVALLQTQSLLDPTFSLLNVKKSKLELYIFEHFEHNYLVLAANKRKRKLS